MKWLGIVALWILGFSVSAQTKLSLEECVDYALRNNIDVKQQGLTQETLQNNYEQYKHNRLPEVSAGINESTTFGRAQIINGTFENLNLQSTIYGNVGASVTLFQGFAKKNTINQQAVSVLMGNEDLNILSNSISLQIAQAYLQILLNKELVGVAKEQINLTKQQMKDMQERVDAGSMPRNNLTELIARAAREKVDLVDAQNNVDLSLLTLSQLLNYKDGSLDIETPTLPEVAAVSSKASSDEIYTQALEVMPEIKKANLGLQSSDLGVKLAKAGYYPTLTLSTSYSSRWYHNHQAANPISFADQLNMNKSAAIGVNLSIPIFSQLQNHTNLKNAKIKQEASLLTLENEKLKLQQNVEQAYLQATASYKRYEAEEQSVLAAQEAFKNKTTELELGKASMTSYNEVKTNVMKAQSNSLQSKYNYIFKALILKFYVGEPLSL